jgi:hypothetical protein
LNLALHADCFFFGHALLIQNAWWP